MLQMFGEGTEITKKHTENWMQLLASMQLK